MSAWDSVKASLKALRAAMDPAAYAELEAQAAPLQRVLEAHERAIERQKLELRGMVGGGATRTTIVNQFGYSGGGGGGAGTFSSSTAGSGGGGAVGNGGNGASSAVSLQGFGGGALPRVTQAHFVQVASRGDITNNVMLQGDDGPGDLVRLAGYQVQPDPATGHMMLTHCEPTPRGATWKDSKRPFPPRGRPYWVRGISLGAAPANGGLPAVILQVAHGDRVDTSDGQRPAERAADRLRFLPEADVLEMVARANAAGQGQKGQREGVVWLFLDAPVGGDLPLLYVAQEGAAGDNRKHWEELYARLLLGEEE